MGRTVHCKLSPHQVHPGVVMELCKALALQRVFHVDHQHRYCRRKAYKTWRGLTGWLNRDERIIVARQRENNPLHHRSILTHAHDMVLCLPRAAFTAAHSTVSPRYHGIRWAAIAHKDIEVSPHRRHGVRGSTCSSSGRLTWRRASFIHYDMFRRTISQTDVFTRQSSVPPSVPSSNDEGKHQTTWRRGEIACQSLCVALGVCSCTANTRALRCLSCRYCMLASPSPPALVPSPAAPAPGVVALMPASAASAACTAPGSLSDPSDAPVPPSRSSSSATSCAATE